MNRWTAESIRLANEGDYLDRLQEIYPVAPETTRAIDEGKWEDVRAAFEARDARSLVCALLGADLFPVKDSYVAFLKSDRNALDRNPQTVERLAGRIFALGLNGLRAEMEKPKEANRQMGSRFQNWIRAGALGVPVLPEADFADRRENCVLAGNDSRLRDFARLHLQYESARGLDIVAKFDNRFVIGEAKFITASGGHQDRQFESAVAVFDSVAEGVKIAVLDGVLYLRNNSRMHRYLHANPGQKIFSALLLRDFLENGV